MALRENKSADGTQLSLNWYALHIRSRHEKRVAERLGSHSLETFLPLHRSRHTWKNGVHVDVDLPLFPCYLFARASIYDRIRLLQHPGVLGFAASSARPTVIPDEEISVLRTALRDKSVKTIESVTFSSAMRRCFSSNAIFQSCKRSPELCEIAIGRTSS